MRIAAAAGEFDQALVGEEFASRGSVAERALQSPVRAASQRRGKPRALRGDRARQPVWRPRAGGPVRPARVPDRGTRSPRRARPDARRGVQRRRRAAAQLVRGQRRQRGGDGSLAHAGSAARPRSGDRGRAPALGPRAARRDAARARRATPCALGRAPARGSRPLEGRDRRRDRRARHRDREPARDHLRRPPGVARRARHAGRARGAGRPHPERAGSTCSSRSTSTTKPAARRRDPTPSSRPRSTAIVQEAMNNAVKHAGAEDVAVDRRARRTASSRSVCATRAAGFDPGRAARLRARRHARARRVARRRAHDRLSTRRRDDRDGAVRRPTG